MLCYDMMHQYRNDLCRMRQLQRCLRFDSNFSKWRSLYRYIDPSLGRQPCGPGYINRTVLYTQVGRGWRATSGHLRGLKVVYVTVFVNNYRCRKYCSISQDRYDKTTVSTGDPVGQHCQACYGSSRQHVVYSGYTSPQSPLIRLSSAVTF